MDDRVRDLLQRHLRAHQRGKGGHHRHRPSLDQLSQHLHPVRDQLIAVDVRLIKNQILGRIQHRTFIIKLVHPGKLLGKLRLVHRAVRIDVDDRVRDLLQRHLRAHQRGKGGHHRHRPSLDQLSQHLHPVRDQLIAVDVRLIENQILGRIQHRTFIIKLVFLIDFSGPQVAVGNDDLIEKIFAQPICQMKLLRVRTARVADAGSILF